MRPFTTARLLMVPALAVALALTASVVSGPAWAGTNGKKPVTCLTLIGNATSWNLMNCTPGQITGGFSTSISKPFPRVAGIYSATITWNAAATEGARGSSTKTTNISGSASEAPKNKCAPGAVEWELLGTLGTQTVTPAVKGKVKIYACVTSGGALNNPAKKSKKRYGYLIREKL